MGLVELPVTEYFSEKKRATAYKLASLCFDKDEDRNDYLQSAFLTTWLQWKKGKKSNLKMVVYETRNSLSHPREFSHDVHNSFEIDNSHKCFMDLFDHLPLLVTKHQPGQVYHKLRSGKGIKIYLNYKELIAFTKSHPSKVGWRRVSKSPLRVYHYKGRAFHRLIDLQKHFKMTPNKARYYAEKELFYWEE